ncbi:MAG: hypothetical protein WDZ67_01915 [Patescibacteria group bacterium]
MMHLFDLMEKILGADNGEAAIEIPEENFNILMLKIIRDKARRENKTVRFTAAGPRGKRLVGSLENRIEPAAEREEGERAAKPIKPRGRFRKILVPLALVLGILIVLGAAAFGALYYLPKAEVVLTLSPIPLIKEIPVAVDAEVEEVDAATGTVPGSSQVVEESGTKSSPATGTAIVGEKAKGTITLDTTGEQTCSQGAKIKENASGSVFLADAAFTIPAFDTYDAAVTAEKIGTSHNLAAGKSFTVLSGCSAAVVGTNAAAFTGGSSEEVTVTSSSDQSKLLTDLQKELVEKAKETIKSRSGTDEVVVDAAIKIEVVEKTYSHAIGEQAESVSLDLKVKLTTVTYKGADIQELISQTLSSLIPSGYTLFPGETQIDPLDPVLKGSKLTFQAEVSAQVIPEIDKEKIKNDLAGRNAGSAQDYLSSLGEVAAFELVLWPNLPESLQRVPRNTNRITVVLKTEE